MVKYAVCSRATKGERERRADTYKRTGMKARKKRQKKTNKQANVELSDK